MSDVLTVILWGLAAGALIRLHVAFWVRWFGLDRSGDEVHFATTEDGWRIAVHHYRPARRRYAEPVFLCPGMGANRYNYDLLEERSLVRTLCTRGFDVWLCELRATGMSSRPRFRNKYSWRFDFDHYLQLDIPAALALVRRRTGSDRVLWVGHSMGGMLGYAWLGLRGDHGVAGLVTISSPVHLRASKLIGKLKPLIWPMALGRVVLWRPFARFFAPFMGYPPGIMTRVTTMPGAAEGRVLRRCLVNLVENTTGAVLRQFISWARRDEFDARDRHESYLANMARIEEPVLILAADRDFVAPPDAVTPAYQLIGSADKQLRVFGTDRGDDDDYGHGDLLLGRHAPDVVFPEIADWLQDHATRLDAASGEDGDAGAKASRS